MKTFLCYCRMPIEAKHNVEQNELLSHLKGLLPFAVSAFNTSTASI